MFAITGITGNVGGEVARNLLAAGRPVRAVVRDVRKGEAWAKRGCDLVGADINEAVALTAAFPHHGRGDNASDSATIPTSAEPETTYDAVCEILAPSSSLSFTLS